MSTYTPSPHTEDVTSEIFERMVSLDMTTEELADRSDIGVKALTNRLEGRAPWLISEVEAVAGALGCEPVDVLLCRATK